MLLFGRTSLFVYWVHVELAYGFVSRPWHKALPLERSLPAFVFLTAVMFVLALGWNWVLTAASGRSSPRG
jgi:hypothetical protein